MRRSSLVPAALGLCLALVVATAQADVYKTVDAQGQVHYSDQWSPGAVLIKGNSSRAPADNTAPPVTSNNQTQAPDSSKAAAKEVQSDMAAVRAEQCKQLKDQYAKEMRARRIYASPTDESSAPKQYLNDADADAERVKTRQAMDEACASSS